MLLQHLLHREFPPIRQTENGQTDSREKNNCLWIYPEHDQIAIQGAENLGGYRFGNRFLRKTFCKICGVVFINERADLTEEEIAAMSEPQRNWTARACGFNVRVLNDFDIKGLKEPYRNEFPATLDPQYVKP